MEHRKLASYIANSITNKSKYYYANVSRHPRIYLRLVNDRQSFNLRHGIIIRKYYDIYWVEARAFVFLPDIAEYVRAKSKIDSDFAKRVDELALTSDDIECMIYTLTHGRMKLRLKGRKVFSYPEL